MFNLKSLLLFSALSLFMFSCEQDDLAAPADNDANISEVSFNQSDEIGDMAFDQSVLVSNEVIMASIGGEDLKGDLTKTGQNASFVYTLSNAVSGNEVIAYRSTAGNLQEIGRFATGGTGTDTNLANQGALILNRQQNLLFATDAGSNSLAMFRVLSNGTLNLVDRVDLRGDEPISVTSFANFVYVVNNGSDDIEGYRVRGNASLSYIQGSQQSLSTTGTAPAQISFGRFGRVLIVTEKATNKITTFTMNSDASTDPGNSFESAADTPFGFSDAFSNIIVVSHATGGRPGEGAVVNYRVDRFSGVVTQSSTVVDDFEGTATCWVVPTRNRRNFFVTNTLTDDITRLRLGLGSGGSTTLATDPIGDNGAVNVGTPSTPHDLGLNRSNNQLFVLTVGSDELVSYQLNNNNDALIQDSRLSTGTIFASGIAVRN